MTAAPHSPDGPNRRPRVLVADAIADSGVDRLSEHFDVDVRTDQSPDELLDTIADYEAIVVRSATKLPADVLDRATNLAVIARAGAGLDTIDVEAALASGIHVVNSPDANTIAVAELTLALILSLARNVPRADAALKDGRWEKKALLGTGIAGKTLGIVGFGRIGRAVAHRAAAFGMKVVANQRRSTPELELEAGVEALDLDDVLDRADFVTLHVPATDETVGLVDADFLARMKSTAWLINTSRGSVVDEAALMAALDDGSIAGAALDVFAEEPAVDSGLARHDRVVATPHLGASTIDAQEAAANDVADQVVDLLADADPRTVLPLRVVEVDRLTPHEAHDPRRVEELAGRLDDEAILRNPPIVTRVDDQFVVLDGATRSEALRRAGHPHLVVQVVDVDDDLSLETWSHVLTGGDWGVVTEALGTVDGLSLVTCDLAVARDRLLELGGVCALLSPDGRAAVVIAEPGLNRFAAAEATMRAYGEVAEVTRTMERDLDTVRVDYPELEMLVVYPPFTVEQVLLAARSGQLLPAGVTRFVVPGRVLHLDLPLSWLRDDRSVEDKNRDLHERLRRRHLAGTIRYYREPVYLLDE